MKPTSIFNKNLILCN